MLGPSDWIELFPLYTVLFPGARLPLRIFEPRYLRLVSDCLKAQRPFGVSLIRSGREVGEAAETAAVGTLAHIVDWQRRDDGLLGIVVRGDGRFRIHERSVDTGLLVRARIEPLPEEPRCNIPPEYAELSDILARVLSTVEANDYAEQADFDDAVWVGFRLAELLPLSLNSKQALLEAREPVARLAQLQEQLRAWGLQS